MNSDNTPKSAHKDGQPTKELPSGNLEFPIDPVLLVWSSRTTDTASQAEGVATPGSSQAGTPSQNPDMESLDWTCTMVENAAGHIVFKARPAHEAANLDFWIRVQGDNDRNVHFRNAGRKQEKGSKGEEDEMPSAYPPPPTQRY